MEKMAEAGNSEQTVDHDQQEISTEKTEVLDKWLLALKEDLASWISRLLKIELNVDSFTSVLNTGVVPCKLANFIQNIGDQFFINNPGFIREGVFPPCGVTFKERGASQGSFFARDNVCNFIRWCRELGVPDVIMFETEDLVSNKNEKAVLLTLLEVARRVFRLGVDPPELVRLENEIDKELENESEPTPPTKVEKVTALKKKHKSHSLDDLVFEVQKKCKCASRYPVQRIADGKYRMGESKNLIFVRVMRKHVMVRVGGGWDTLDRYFEKHDPCRIVAQRKPSKTSRPPSASHAQDMGARSPSSMSTASVSSTDSFDSTSTAYSHMSVSSTPPPQSVSSKCGRSPRHRTLSGGTSSPTYDRCASPRRGSNARHKSPCQRGTPPRTIETRGKLSKRSSSMHDLQPRGSDAAGVTNIPVPTKQRPISARRRSATPANEVPGKTAQGTPGQRRKSVAVSPRKDSAGAAIKQRKQSTTRPSCSDTSQNSMHNRSRSMQDLNKYNLTGPLDNDHDNDSRKSRSRPTSARSVNAPSQRKPSTTQATRKTSNGSFCDSPSRQTPIHGSLMNSPRTARRSSSTPRTASGYSPVSSPRVSRRQSSSQSRESRETQKSSVRQGGTTVNSPGTMRRAISNLTSLSTSYRVKRSASFDSTPVPSPRALENGTATEKVKYRDISKSPSKAQSAAAVKSPTKPSRVPIKIPGKQATAKQSGLRAPTKPSVRRDQHKVSQNGYQQAEEHVQNNLVGEYDDDLPTPFDNYTYTSEEKACLLSDKDYILAQNDSDLNLDFSGSYRQTKLSNSGGSTPDTVKTIDSFLGGAVETFSTTTSEYDYPDYESDDISGLKSPRSFSSGLSISPSPTKELFESRDGRTVLREGNEAVGNVGIMQRLKSLNVEQSSVKRTLRDKIFTPNETDVLDGRGSTPVSSGRQEHLKSTNSFSLVEYSNKEPEERSKFFDIEKECPAVESSDGHDITDQLGCPRKFSLVHALIGSIEKRNAPNRNIEAKKTTDTTDTTPIVCDLSTESRTGDEAVTGSCGTAQVCGLADPKPSNQNESSTSFTSFSSDDLQGQRLDENDNLQVTYSLSKVKEKQNHTPLELEELRQFEEDEKYVQDGEGMSETESPQHASLEEMIQDMLPGRDKHDE